LDKILNEAFLEINFEDNSLIEEQSYMPKNYEGHSFSLSSWADIPLSTFINDSDETFSLSLRAKLLYGKHSFESLLLDGSFGNKAQIISTLEACEELGVLITHSSQVDSHEVSQDEGKKPKNSIYSKLLKWLG